MDIFEGEWVVAAKRHKFVVGAVAMGEPSNLLVAVVAQAHCDVGLAPWERHEERVLKRPPVNAGLRGVDPFPGKGRRKCCDKGCRPTGVGHKDCAVAGKGVSLR